MRSPSRILKHLGAALALLNLTVASSLAVAGDNTWTNGSTDFTWNTTSLNWSGAGSVWNNGAGDGAIFGSTGIGSINLPGATNVNSINFQQNGYGISGAGSLNFVNGTSTLTTGVINVASGTTQLDVPIGSSQTIIQKVGAGTLVLTAPVSISATFPLTNGENYFPLSINLLVGPSSGQSVVGGTLKITSPSVLPTNTAVGLGYAGVLDIGASNITIGSLTFLHQNSGATYPGSFGVVGSGNLRVTGEINVIGTSNGLNFANAIDSGLDLGGGTQVIRTAQNGSFSGPAALMITGVISNGSLLKTVGVNESGVTSASNADGIGLFGNNTYTGATIINAGTNGFGNGMATGTNASTSIKVANSIFNLQGANGSYGSASTVQILSGGTLLLDNNATFGAAGLTPVVPAAQNNDRLKDSASVELRDGSLVYRGLTSVAATETFGALNVTGGHNVITLTPNGVSSGGTVTLTSNGNLSLDPRATMQVAVSGSGAVLGTNTKLLVTGTVPSAIGGIIPRMIATSDFLTYDATNGFTPLSSYSSTLAGGGNVSLGAATSTSGTSPTINALKTTASMALTVSSGDTLSVTSGMLLPTTGTLTVNGPGTLSLGNASNPGVIFGSSTTFAVGSKITGSQGLLYSGTGTLTLSGDLSGLSGTLSNIGTGIMTLSNDTFAGPIEVRRGTLNLNSNTLSAGGAITVGVAANDSYLLPANPGISISGAGANAVINRNFIIDNGATNAAGMALNRSTLNPTLSALSNATGSQTINGNITLNTGLNFSTSFSASTTNATNFAGAITGPGLMTFTNGRVILSGTQSNAGGMYIGVGGGTTFVTFAGNASGNAPIVLNAVGTNVGFAYSNQSNLYSGPITVNIPGNPASTIRILGTSSINNSITLNGGVNADVGANITGTWAGTLNGTGNLTKTSAGTLVLSNNSNTQTGAVTVNAGTLAVNGNLAASTNAVTVNANATLGGNGTISRTVTVAANGSLAPGNSPGQLTIDGNLTLAANSSFKLELNGTTLGTTYDNVTVAGLARTVTITNAILSPTTTSTTLMSGDKMFVMVLNDSASTVGTTFAGIAQDGLVSISGIGGGDNYSAQVSYTGDFGSGGISGGNDVVLYNFAAVPEPTTIAFLGLLSAGGVGGWYYRRRRLAKLMDANL